MSMPTPPSPVCQPMPILVNGWKGLDGAGAAGTVRTNDAAVELLLDPLLDPLLLELEAKKRLGEESAMSVVNSSRPVVFWARP